MFEKAEFMGINEHFEVISNTLTEENINFQRCPQESNGTSLCYNGVIVT